MSSRESLDYFDLIFCSSFRQGAIETDKKFWVFENLFRDGFAALPEAIKQDFSGIDSLILRPEACQSLADSLQKRLKSILGPVFQANYHGLLERAEADGLIPKKRTKVQEAEVQQWFLKTMQREGTARLFTTNAHLKKATQKIIDDWMKNNKIFLKRLAKDANQLHELSHTPKRKKIIVLALQCDLSDPHHGGEAVKIVTLAGGKFVYKPRSLAPERSFYLLLEHINSLNVLTQLYIPWIIDNKKYGWMEYCQPLSEITAGFDIKQYAYQFGTLCVLWYLLGGTDLHHENILFTDKGVVIVDCETIFEADFASSVLSASTVPSLEPSATTHSLLGTLALMAHTSDLNPKEETIYHIGGIANFKELFEKLAKNKRGKWKTFTDAVFQTLETTFRYFQKQPPEDVMGLVKKYFSGNMPVRLVLRPTSGYGALLHNFSINFDVLKTSDKAFAYLDEQLTKIPLPYIDTADPGVIRESEIRQLARFDIPYFIRELGKHCISSEGWFEASLGEKTDFSSVEFRLAWLQNPSFIENEIHLAKIALTPRAVIKNYTKTGSDAHDYREYHYHTESFYSYVPFNSERAIHKALSDIADQLQGELANLEHFENAFFITQHQKNKHVYQPIPASYSLFSGWAGRLLFLGTYAAVTSRPELVRLVKQKLVYFIKLGENREYILKHRRGGLGAGYQSLVYVFERLKRIGILDDYPVELAEIALQPESSPAYDYDFVTATSGNVLLATLLNNKTSQATLSEWSRQLKQSMKNLLDDWEAKKDKNLVGMAHGALGPCLAASRLYQAVLKDAELKNLTLDLATKEETLVQERREADDPIGSTSGWCYGKAGRGLTYYYMGRAFGLGEFIEKARGLTVLDDKNLGFQNHTLCCGSLGYIATHLTIRKDLPDYQEVAYRLQKLNEFYKNPKQLLVKDERKNSCMMPMGLFYGLSGLGMVLLHYLEPNVVPDVFGVE